LLIAFYLKIAIVTSMEDYLSEGAFQEYDYNQEYSECDWKE